jgi:TonB family protein
MIYQYKIPLFGGTDWSSGNFRAPAVSNLAGRAPQHHFPKGGILAGSGANGGVLMQNKSAGKLERERTNIDTLTRCLVDGDSATTSRDRQRRRRALGVSLTIEVSVLALLIASPLLSGVPQPRFAGTAFVPLVFGASHNPSPIQHSPALIRRPSRFDHRLLTFLSGQAPVRPMPEPRVDAADMNSDQGVPIAFPDQEGPVISGFRPADSTVQPPPGERQKLEEKRPVKVSEPLQLAQLTSRVEPRYPIIAIQTHTEGAVRLHAIISREGRITALEVLSGSPLLVQAAADAVREWQYRPTYLNGAPVEVETSISVIFQLRR